jgi:hypothetical protein
VTTSTSRTRSRDAEEEWVTEASEWFAWHQDTVQLYRDVRTLLTDYVVFQHEYDSIAVTLWILHTHLIDEFVTTPRLVIRGPDKPCGKSRLMECLELLCRNARVTITPTMSTVFREIAASNITVLQDEYQAVFDTNGIPELQAAYNAGWRRKGGTVPRTEKIDGQFVVVRYPVFAPVAFAGTPAEDRHNDVPPMILDRSVIIEMNRKLPDEVVEDFDSIVAEHRGGELQRHIRNWSKSIDVDTLPMVPDGIRDRQRDIWRPLLQVAELAGDHDVRYEGAWPEAARITCATKCEVQTLDDDESSMGKRLLLDIRSVFTEWGNETRSGDAFMKTLEVLYYLQHNEEWDWNAKEYGQPILNAHKLAKYLKVFGIAPHTVARCDDPDGKRSRSRYYNT